ncbi:hypothetical protein Gorai_014206 [Gossypium raimondii]|uniref:Uncharacterized protein n=1 Tax=Gossypium raimondii TaxID=29730 RepID=A0A7J8P2E1_GOSRA|nr:hypothetical protein [Gossypium raimondii]
MGYMPYNGLLKLMENQLLI